MEKITYGKFGKFLMGKNFGAFEKMVQKTPMLGKLANSKHIVLAGGVELAIGSVGEFGEEVITPFAEYLAGNMMSGGNGKVWAEMIEDTKAVFDPRNMAMIATNAFLLGGVSKLGARMTTERALTEGYRNDQMLR